MKAERAPSSITSRRVSNPILYGVSNRRLQVDISSFTVQCKYVLEGITFALHHSTFFLVQITIALGLEFGGYSLSFCVVWRLKRGDASLTTKCNFDTCSIPFLY